ncbi:FecR domain-containing protein [Chitinophaga sp.]|uniref:FecR family protein n=1 Tax=Chitinophaga sp. TaxID=1869181 RepID=UPI0031DA72F3
MNRIKTLIDKFSRGECTPMELEEVARWLQDGQAEDVPPAAGNREAIWQKIERRRRPPLLMRLARWAPAAAVLLGLIVLYWLWKPAVQERTVRAAAAQSIKVVLPDSSVAFLRGPAVLRYPAEFEHGKRVVCLEGAATFEVKSSPGHLFTVVSGKVSTTAMGTSFEVIAPAGSDSVNVMLRYGKVVVARDRDSVYLRPGEGLHYTGAHRTVRRLEPGSSRNGVLYFQEAGLKEVMGKLAAHYGLHVTADTALYNRPWRINGEFTGKDAAFVTRSIAFIADVSYRLEGDSLRFVPVAQQP